MAVLIKKEDLRKEFKNLLPDKEEAKIELDAYEKNGLLEYAYLVYLFCKALKVNDISYEIRCDKYPSYLMELLGVDSGNHFRNYHQNLHYLLSHREDCFDLYIPSKKKKEVVKLFETITNVLIKEEEPSTLYFGDNYQYNIHLIQHTYLYRLDRINRDALKDIHMGDEAVLSYMFSQDSKGFYMPNLFRCVIGEQFNWYRLIDIVQPKTIKDFQFIVCLMKNIYLDYDLLIDQINEYGKCNILYCKDQIYHILCDSYDVDEHNVDRILLSISHLGRLTEGDELILETHEVPDYIINQIENVKYWSPSENAVIDMELIYKLAYVKFYYQADFIKSLHPVFKENRYVGPFFYIGNQIKAHRVHLRSFEYDLRFLDSNMSHLLFFDDLGIEGDYGNYPRGRVIFDQFHQQFLVYLDKTLLRNSIKQQIIEEYCLDDAPVVFRLDSHYVHDRL